MAPDPASRAVPGATAGGDLAVVAMVVMAIPAVMPAPVVMAAAAVAGAAAAAVVETDRVLLIAARDFATT